MKRTQVDHLIFALAAAVYAGGIAGMVFAVIAPVRAPGPQRPTMRVLDHPRCFPPGTLATEGFPGCPDSLPDQRAA